MYMMASFRPPNVLPPLLLLVILFRLSGVMTAAVPVETNQIRNQRDYRWQSSAMPAYPEPGDPGIPIDDDDLDFISDSTWRHNRTSGGRWLSAGHRCRLNKTGSPSSSASYCKDNLQCIYRNVLFGDLATAEADGYGLCTEVDCQNDCHKMQIDGHPKLKCPDDSIPFHTIIANAEGKRCCLNTCVCQTHSQNIGRCKSNSERCPHGYILNAKANDMPGKCCDHIKCLNITFRNCTDDYGVTYGQGQHWQTIDCHRCRCNDGVRECDAIRNCPIGCLAGYDNIALTDGQCCLPCKGCTHEGARYEHQQTWQDSECRRCTCQNEKVICSIESNGPKFCDRPCTINERREWHNDKCCDRCVCDPYACPNGFKSQSKHQFNDSGEPPCQCATGDDDHSGRTIDNNNDEDVNHQTTITSSSFPVATINSTMANDDYGQPYYPSNTDANHANQESLIFILSLAAIAVVILFTVLYWLCCFRRRCRKNTNDDGSRHRHRYCPTGANDAAGNSNAETEPLSGRNIINGNR